MLQYIINLIVAKYGVAGCVVKVQSLKFKASLPARIRVCSEDHFMIVAASLQVIPLPTIIFNQRQQESASRLDIFEG